MPGVDFSRSFGGDRPRAAGAGDRPEDSTTRAMLEEQIARVRKKRDDARWSLVVGVGMTFLTLPAANFGGIAYALLTGGVLTTLYGLTAWSYWGWRLGKLDDPWRDDPTDYDPETGPPAL